MKQDDPLIDYIRQWHYLTIIITITIQNNNSEGVGHIVELFSLALTAKAFSEICGNRRFLKGWVTESTNFYVDGDVARNPSMNR